MINSKWLSDSYDQPCMKSSAIAVMRAEVQALSLVFLIITATLKGRHLCLPFTGDKSNISKITKLVADLKFDTKNVSRVYGLSQHNVFLFAH